MQPPPQLTFPKKKKEKGTRHSQFGSMEFLVVFRANEKMFTVWDIWFWATWDEVPLNISQLVKLFIYPSQIWTRNTIYYLQTSQNITSLTICLLLHTTFTLIINTYKTSQNITSLSQCSYFYTLKLQILSHAFTLNPTKTSETPINPSQNFNPNESEMNYRLYIVKTKTIVTDVLQRFAIKAAFIIVKMSNGNQTFQDYLLSFFYSEVLVHDLKLALLTLWEIAFKSSRMKHLLEPIASWINRSGENGY